MTNVQKSSLSIAKNLENYVSEMFSKLMVTANAANQIPSSAELDFYGTVPSFRKQLQIQNDKLMNMIEAFQKYVEVGNDTGDEVISELQELTSQFESVVDILDRLLEQADVYLDSFQGIIPGSSTASTIVNSFTESNKASSNLRPQLTFVDPIDNGYGPHVPKVAHLGDRGSAVLKSFYLNQADPGNYPHPFQDLLIALSESLDNYMPSQRKTRVEKVYKKLEECKLHWVETIEDLVSMIRILENVEEIAVDVEHHDYRSYFGFVCLVQISTRNEDFVVDAIKLRASMHLLSSVFSNPRIVKVFHGMESDVMWLQRDFGLFIVNAFDTGQAARILQFPSLSLAFLLQHICGVTVDKKYQLADWRVRPLPNSMLNYAREDTHYLLYIYDRLSNQLVEKGNPLQNLLQATYKRTNEICSRIYIKPALDADNYLHLMERMGLKFNKRQIFALEQLIIWRDRAARAKDESRRYVLSNHQIARLAELLPIDEEGLAACCGNNRLGMGDKKELFGILELARSGTTSSTTIPTTITSTTTTREEPVDVPSLYVVANWKGNSSSTARISISNSNPLSSATKASDFANTLTTDNISNTNLERANMIQDSVPQSLGDIYKWSSESRKKTRTKKREIQEEKVVEMVTKKKKKEVKQDTKEFLNSIGWKEDNSNFRPFDYSGSQAVFREVLPETQPVADTSSTTTSTVTTTVRNSNNLPLSRGPKRQPPRGFIFTPK